MTSPHDSGFAGHLRIRPALNATERDHLRALAGSGGTLRGTPTGRGDREVPFAWLGWEVCEGGCCLTWSPGLEDARMMLPTLRFLVDHLLGRGARAQGRAGFEGFTFDHVLEGVVLGCAARDVESRLVEVVGDSVTERLLPRGCPAGGVRAPVRATGHTRRGKLPQNVIEFRPRGA